MIKNDEQKIYKMQEQIVKYFSSKGVTKIEKLEIVKTKYKQRNKMIVK